MSSGRVIPSCSPTMASVGTVIVPTAASNRAERNRPQGCGDRVRRWPRSLSLISSIACFKRMLRSARTASAPCRRPHFGASRNTFSAVATGPSRLPRSAVAFVSHKMTTWTLDRHTSPRSETRCSPPSTGRTTSTGSRDCKRSRIAADRHRHDRRATRRRAGRRGLAEAVAGIGMITRCVGFNSVRWWFHINDRAETHAE